MTQSSLKFATHAINAVGIVVTLGILLQVNAATGQRAIFGDFLVLLPYLVLSALTSVVSRITQTIAFAIAAVLIVAFAAYTYTDTLLVHPDAQSGLIIVIVLPCQLAAIFMAWITAVIVQLVRKV